MKLVWLTALGVGGATFADLQRDRKESSKEIVNFTQDGRGGAESEKIRCNLPDAMV